MRDELPGSFKTLALKAISLFSVPISLLLLMLPLSSVSGSAQEVSQFPFSLGRRKLSLL